MLDGAVFLNKLPRQTKEFISQLVDIASGKQETSFFLEFFYELFFKLKFHTNAGFTFAKD